MADAIIAFSFCYDMKITSARLHFTEFLICVFSIFGEQCTTGLQMRSNNGLLKILTLVV